MIAPYPFSTSGAALLLLTGLHLHPCVFNLIDISSPVILVFSCHPSTLFWLTPLSFPPSLSFYSPSFPSLACPQFQFPYLSAFAPTALAVVQPLSCVWLFVTPWTAALEVSLSFTISWGLLKLMSTESAMPSSHLTFCCPLLLLSSILPSIRVFSNEPALCIRGLKIQLLFSCQSEQEGFCTESWSWALEGRCTPIW